MLEKGEIPEISIESYSSNQLNTDQDMFKTTYGSENKIRRNKMPRSYNKLGMVCLQQTELKTS